MQHWDLSLFFCLWFDDFHGAAIGKYQIFGTARQCVILKDIAGINTYKLNLPL